MLWYTQDMTLQPGGTTKNDTRSQYYECKSGVSVVWCMVAFGRRNQESGKPLTQDIGAYSKIAGVEGVWS